MTVGELLYGRGTPLSSREHTEWEIIHRIEGIGESRADLRTGRAMAPLLNLLSSAHFKHPKHREIMDWVVDCWKKPEQQSPEEMKALFKGIADAAALDAAAKPKAGPRKIVIVPDKKVIHRGR